MVSLFAFLHHVAAFTLVATLAVEFVLVRGEVGVENARRLQLTDLIFGISASVILIVGFIRVYYFEKGASYYFHSAPFIAKISLFAVVGLLSIYPTLQFLAWRRESRRGVAPSIAPARMRTIRALITAELIGVVLIILCAALMARGVGYLGP